MTNVVIDVYEKATEKKIASQTVKRVYTHFAETQSFTANGSLVLPYDTIGFSYETEGKKGNAGTGASETANLLQVRSKACATNYQPNNAGNACVACPAPSGDKQYRSGDCTIGTCGMGYKANASRTECEAITCPSGRVLQGDSCVEDVPMDSCSKLKSDCRNVYYGRYYEYTDDIGVTRCVCDKPGLHIEI